ncbi:hypothetical protein ACP70R_015563 [Stipagrostis hirtigluma subsp. patula]
MAARQRNNTCNRLFRLGSSSNDDSSGPDEDSTMEDQYAFTDTDTDQSGIINEDFESSAMHVSSLIGKFDDNKKKLVESIGFGGILQIPKINKVNRAFTVWLLSRMKWWSASIEVGENICLTMLPQHIEQIVGIPCSGSSVADSAFQDAFAKIDFIKRILGNHGDSAQRLEAAQRLLETELPMNATREQISRFKAAFVIFVMDRFLAPTYSRKHGNSDYWGALVNADDIGKYNWADYVLDHMKDAARTIDWDGLANAQPKRIACCALILQIFYLDNMDFGRLNLEHSKFPRISAFTTELIKQMIQADTCHGPGSCGEPKFGCNKARSKLQTVYTFPSTSQISSPSTIDAYLLTQPRSQHNKKAATTHKRRATSGADAVPQPFANSQKKLVGMELSDCGPIPNFSTILNKRYPDLVHDPDMDSLKVLHARTIQHFNKLKNSITEEYLDFANKVLGRKSKQLGKESDNDTNNLSADMTTYHGILSGTESGDDSSSRMKGQKRANWLQAKATPPKYMIKNPKKGIAGNNTDVPNNQLKIEHPTTEVGGPAQRSLICDDMYKTPEATKMMFPFVGSTSASPMEELSLFASSSVAIRLLENINQFDLNARVLDEERINSPVRKKPVVQGNYADSPWKAGLILPDKDYIVTANFFNWLTSTNETIIKASLVVHDIPRFIDISGLDIKEQFTGQKAMSYEVFDIAIRTLNQKENLMYLTAGRLHWRHYLESDFAMYALSDEKPSDSLHIREQFIGSSVECDLPNCRILVVPVRSKYCWWSYVIDFGAKKCYIIDPSSSKKTSVEILNLHDASEEKVLKALEQTLDDLISCPSNLTGLYTLYCVNNFDGAGFAAAPTEAAINSFARNLVYEMIELKGNRAPKPKDFVQIIED